MQVQLYGRQLLPINLSTESTQSVKITQVLFWRGDRVVDGNGLENRRGETHRGFESLPLRQVVHVGTPVRRKPGGGFVLPVGGNFAALVRLRFVVKDVDVDCFEDGSIQPASFLVRSDGPRGSTSRGCIFEH